MRIERPDLSDNDSPGDGRRARLADLQRLELALSEAAGRLKAIEDFISRRDNEPIPRGQFYGQFYAMCALSGKSAKHFRAWADEAWRTYLAALSDSPKSEIQQGFGDSKPDAVQNNAEEVPMPAQLES